MLSDCTLETGVNMSAMYVGACPIDALWTIRHRQYHSDLSDQSALESRVRIRARLKVALF